MPRIYIHREGDTPVSPASASCGSVAPGFSRTLAIDPLFPPREPRRLCAELESGNIILLARSPIVIPDEDRELLLERRRQQSRSPYHKNIAYRPVEDRITGLSGSAHAKSEHLSRILRDYSERVAGFFRASSRPTRTNGSWTTPVTVPSRRKRALRGCTLAMICFISIRFLLAQLTARVFSGFSPTSILERAAFG